MHATKTVLVATGLMLLGITEHARANCKYEINEPEAQESKVFVIARGFNTGLSGHMGRDENRYYLRGRYYTSFAGTPSFDHSTPMTLTLSDDSQLTLPLYEGAEGKLDWHPMLANNREANPVFLVEQAHFEQIQQGNIKAVELRRIDKGKLGSKHYKVSKRAAKKIAEAARCVAAYQPSGPS